MSTRLVSSRLLCAALLVALAPFAAAQQSPVAAGQERDAAQGKEYREYEVKAAYLLQFLRYVTWPKRADDDKAPLVIGVVGKSPFGKVFDSVDGKEVEGTGRKLKVKKFDVAPKDAELRACHIVFVCKSEQPHLEELLAAVADHPVLTVTEGDRMIERGVAFGFVLEERKVRIEYNSEATQRAKLKVSAQLQRVVVRRL
ncbi:MAG: YfiR family protein [Planctomycetes bacterium]|nr:YfiR family protein [Planctomycetota bacterium]MCB9885045.1 YfiR family protein [Planctomycetota bacterium]